eukprot:559246-Pleurochrysis_carterae.AAC.2
MLMTVFLRKYPAPHSPPAHGGQMLTNRELLQQLLIYRLLLQSPFDDNEGVDIKERMKGEMPTSQQILGCGDRTWNWTFTLAVSVIHHKMKTLCYGV